MTVMTGVYEYDFNEFLVKNGLSVLSQPLNVNETIGGMLAVSTHVNIFLLSGIKIFYISLGLNNLLDSFVHPI